MIMTFKITAKQTKRTKQVVLFVLFVLQKQKNMYSLTLYEHIFNYILVTLYYVQMMAVR